jgi:uncharacterized protein (TIGR02597 family)
MKLLRPRFLFALLALAPAALMAQSASVPQGYMNFTIPAGSVGTPSVYTFSLPLSAPVPGGFVGQPAGKISSVTATTITNDSAGWTAGALSQAASPWFIRIVSGTAAGRTLQVTSQASTATTVTIDNQGTDLTTLGIVAGDKYELFPAYTLQAVFGSSVLGGTSSGTADVVRLHNGSGWIEYYFNSTANQWRTGAIPVSQNNVVIRPDSGVIFYRRGTTPIALTLTGKVPSTNLQVVLNEVGTAFVAGFPFASTLDNSDYKAMPGWVNNTGTVSNADKLTALVSGSWNSYNFNQTASQWRNGSIPVNQGSNVTITAGAPVVIESPTGTPGLKIWTRPLPYSISAN